MRSFIEHARSFGARMAADGRSLAPLAHGQSPLALFITCSDSRVVPSLITGARPGELFELRTAGGIVPHYDLNRPAGETATVEFAVRSLEVADIVICGHSQCAAVAARVRGDDLSAVPAMDGWLTHPATAPSTATRAPAPALPPGPGHGYNRSPGHRPDPPGRHARPGTMPEAKTGAGHGQDLSQAVRRHVLDQLDRLRHYPCVAERLHQGRIGLHGWFYEVHTGTVQVHRPADGTFLPL